MADKELKMSTDGTPREVGEGYLPDGSADLRPTAGYAHKYPVQFPDENDAEFAGRVAMFESSYASARQTEAGGPTLETATTAMEARHKAELLALEAQFPEAKKGKKTPK